MSERKDKQLKYFGRPVASVAIKTLEETWVFLADKLKLKSEPFDFDEIHFMTDDTGRTLSMNYSKEAKLIATRTFVNPVYYEVRY